MSSIPHDAQSSQTDADADEVLLGVDTDRDAHVAAVITTLGVLVGTRCFPSTIAGYQQLVDWARSFGSLRRAGVESPDPTERL